MNVKMLFFKRKYSRNSMNSGLNSQSDTYKLCDLGQVTSPSFSFSSMKHKQYLSYRCLVNSNYNNKSVAIKDQAVSISLLP